MGIDNLEDQKDSSGSSANGEQSGGQAAGGSEPEGGNASRLDAAKAFFRAMYAGDEPEKPAASQNDAPVDNRRVQQLEMQCKDLEQRAADAESAYKRLMADFDNFRRRVERERDEYTNNGIKKAAEAFINGLDDLDRALLYLTPETPAQKIVESFQLVGSRIFACMEQAGIKRMDTKGVEFDPRLHEPVMQVDSADHPDNTIVQELRAGYFLGDKVMRAALVSVASNPSIPAPSVVAAREEAERQKQEAERQREEAEQAKAEAEKQRQEAERVRKEAEARRKELEAEKEIDIEPVPELESSAAAPSVPPPKKAKAQVDADPQGVYDLGDLDDV